MGELYISMKVDFCLIACWFSWRIVKVGEEKWQFSVEVTDLFATRSPHVCFSLQYPTDGIYSLVNDTDKQKIVLFGEKGQGLLNLEL